MSWLLKSKRLQSAGTNASNNSSNGSTTIGSNHQASSNASAGASTSASYNSLASLGSNPNNASTSSLSSSLSLSLSQQQLLHPPSSSLDHHHHLTEDMIVRTFAASQLDTQKTAFMRWVNVQLSHTNHPPMTAIDRDLKDGKRLIALLEIVSKEPLKPERGNMRIHQMANVSKALAFLEKRTEDALGSIGNEDIVDGNLKLTLGLVWIIIYRFQIQQIANTMAEMYPALVDECLETDEHKDKTKKKPSSSHQVDAKQALLRWVRLQLEDYADVIPPIQDFHRSWRTGLAFAALIHRHDPAFIPHFYTDILPLPFDSTEVWRSTLTQAFDLAYEHMALPRLLDPQDLVNVETPDERSIMTYISEYYLAMSRHQHDQDLSLASQQRSLRIQAKNERLALAGEDQQAIRRRIQEEEERRQREEQEELERIRLRRMEIEGWSIRASERAKEEEEARRKRHEEETEKRLQRKLRREQRERDKALLHQQSTGSTPGSALKDIFDMSSMGPSFSDSGEDDYSDSDSEPVDPKEQERRQKLLEDNLAEYHQGITELAYWVRNQDADFPRAPDTGSPLERSRDFEPFTEAIKLVEEAQAIKEHVMSHLHDVREELLEFEDLAPEQVSDMDKKWWELETLWTALSNKVVEAKDTAEEVKWIIDCSQEIDRVNGEILKFEVQLEAAAEKRSQETPQERSQKSVLEQQDVNLSSISFLIKTYVDFLTSLMDPKVHHYTAPEHLTALNTELTTIRLPHLAVIIEKAQQNLANDRLLRSFLDAFVLSEAWIGESVEWLANIEVPVFVSEDVWSGANTVKAFMAREEGADPDLDFFQAEAKELKGELEDEQAEVTTFRSSGFAKLDEQAKAVMKSLEVTQDRTAADTIQVVQELMKGVMDNLQKVEDLLPKEAVHCAYAMHVLEYLLQSRDLLDDIEGAYDAISAWEMRQPDSDMEALVIKVEDDHGRIEAAFSVKGAEDQPFVWSSIQIRHAGLTDLVQDLRFSFREKQEAIHGDRKMRDFLEYSLACQSILRDFRFKLQDDPPRTGFGFEDTTPLDDFVALVALTGQSLEQFEEVKYHQYLDMGAIVAALAASSDSRQDPTIVESKLDCVRRLLDGIKALQADRKQDVSVVKEGRQLVSKLSQLNSDFETLASDSISFESLEPGQQQTLDGFVDRLNHLTSQGVLLQQEPAYKMLTDDPSCTGLLKSVQNKEASVRQRHKALQAGLDLKQQWDIAWDRIMERSATLEQYLQNTENEIADRGYADKDIMKEGHSWKMSHEELSATQSSNAQTHSSLQNFERSRLAELARMITSLDEVLEQDSAIRSLDHERLERTRQASERKEALRTHLERLLSLNEKEASQLELIRKRLEWMHQLEDSADSVHVLNSTCQAAVQEYSDLAKKSLSTGVTSNLNERAALHLKEQVAHVAVLANKRQDEKMGAALAAYRAMLDHAGSMSETPTYAPVHIVAELTHFHEDYDTLGQHLLYAQDLADHALSVAAFLDRSDSVDNGLRSMATELRAEVPPLEASLDKLSLVRMDLDVLSKDALLARERPAPVDTISALYAGTLQELEKDLSHILDKRIRQSAEMNKALEPLVAEFHSLLRFQGGLGDLQLEVDEHAQWIADFKKRVQCFDQPIQELFSTWPGTSNIDQSATNPCPSKNAGDLMAEMQEELARMESRKQDFDITRETVQGALLQATVHFKKHANQLEVAVNIVANHFETLESELRNRMMDIQCSQQKDTWDQELNRAQAWFHETDQAIAQFIQNQARWAGDASTLDLPQQAVETLNSSLEAFEDQIDRFSQAKRPDLEDSWSDLCASLVFADRSLPQEFQDRQAALEQDEERLRRQIVYGFQVVRQRKDLEAISATVDKLTTLEKELEGFSKESCLRNISEAHAEDAFETLVTQMYSASKDIKLALDSLVFPVNDLSREREKESLQANAAIEQFVKRCRDDLKSTAQMIAALEQKRAQSRQFQLLESMRSQQDSILAVKAGQLERVTGLMVWVEETAEVVAGLLLDELTPCAEQTFAEPTLATEAIQSMSTSSSSSSPFSLSESNPSMATLSVSNSTTSMITLAPSAPGSHSNLASRGLPCVSTWAGLDKIQLIALSAKAESTRKEIEDMKDHKDIFQAEVLNSTQHAIVAFVEPPELEQQILQLEIAECSREGSKKSHQWGTAALVTLAKVKETIRENETRLGELDTEIRLQLNEFDSKTTLFLEQLNQHTNLLSLATKERQRLDDEMARQNEAEQRRRHKEAAKKSFQVAKEDFLNWSQDMLQSQGQMWETHAYFSHTEDDSSEDARAPNPILLEADLARCHDEIVARDPQYVELRSTLESVYNDLEDLALQKVQAAEMEEAWILVKQEAQGYSALVEPIKAWADFEFRLAVFEEDGLESMEKRVDSLRWMHFEAFQQEEASLLEFIDSVESQAKDLQEIALQISTLTATQGLKGHQRSIFEANKSFFEEKMSSVPGRLEAARSQMELIHETSREIALHGKFHADLVRIETALAQQIDTVKARLGSLERLCCFSLNSKALEKVVVSANEVSMDAKYQLSVLQEVEYAALEQTAFDLDMNTTEDQFREDSENNPSDRSGVQESMDRIRSSLRKLEAYVEEDCFETLAAAKFYTHAKATEDIRQWISACRDSMAQISVSGKEIFTTAHVDRQADDKVKDKSYQAKDLAIKQLGALEKKLSKFGATVQDYDLLSSEFLLLQQPHPSTLSLSEATMDTDDGQQVSMKVILRQSVQERAKRTREDWELLKQEFLTKTVALDESNMDESGDQWTVDAAGQKNDSNRRESASGFPSLKAKSLSKYGAEILEDISRVSRELQDMFDHGASNLSTLSLAVESDGALIKSKEGQARLEMIEGYIKDVLQAKVEKLDAMLSAADDQELESQSLEANSSQQDLSDPKTDKSTNSHVRHHEKMVGVAMQRGLIAESMNRLVESCHHQRREVEETVRVQNAMDLIHEASQLCDAVINATASADRLLLPPAPAEGAPNVSIYNLSSASMSSSSSLTSIPGMEEPLSHRPNGSSSRISSAASSRSTLPRQRRSSRISLRRSFSFSSLSGEEVHRWESSYRSLMEKLDGLTTEIETRLGSVSTMVDRLDDWRLEEKYGVATEHWQKVKQQALAKKQELDRVWAGKSGHSSSGEVQASIHPLEGLANSSRTSVMQPTASSNNRVKAILGSPVETTSASERRKRFSTGNIMSRGTFEPPSPTSASGTGTVGRSPGTGRVRSGTAPGLESGSRGSPMESTRRTTLMGSASSLQAMSPTFSHEAKRRVPIIRKNDSTSSLSSILSAQEATSPSLRPQRTVYKADPSNALDVEVARVVNASGFTMKVQKLKDGHGPHLSAGGIPRRASDATLSQSLVGETIESQEGVVGSNESPRAKTIRGQGRTGLHTKASSSPGRGEDTVLSGTEAGRYVFGDIEPKICYCRILRSRKVMVRVGGGWSELSKFMEDHASLEQRKARGKLSASNSSASIASTFRLRGSDPPNPSVANSESRSSSHSLSDPTASEQEDGEPTIMATTTTAGATPRIRKKKELIYHIRPSDDLSLKTIKFVKNGAGEGLVAL